MGGMNRKPGEGQANTNGGRPTKTVAPNLRKEVVYRRAFLTLAPP